MSGQYGCEIIPVVFSVTKNRVIGQYDRYKKPKQTRGVRDLSTWEGELATPPVTGIISQVMMASWKMLVTEQHKTPVSDSLPKELRVKCKTASYIRSLRNANWSDCIPKPWYFRNAALSHQGIAWTKGAWGQGPGPHEASYPGATDSAHQAVSHHSL